jgi:hypothetical protein
MHESRFRHLEMIQAVITRLAGNSFVVKKWSIASVAALLALAAKDVNERYAILALLPALSFWGLDAYYLRQERLFRALYDHVRTDEPETPSAFSMNTAIIGEKVKAWPRTLGSAPLVGLHAPVVAVIVGVLLYALCK